MKALKTMAMIAAVLLLAITSQEVSANNAYSGYNTIGNYQQYQITYQERYAEQGNYIYPRGTANGGPLTIPNEYYAYPTTPRAGGWFGKGGWTIGLRAPTYYDVAPTHYGNFYRPYTYRGGGGYGGRGGHGSQPTTPIRVRYGGGL